MSQHTTIILYTQEMDPFETRKRIVIDKKQLTILNINKRLTNQENLSLRKINEEVDTENDLHTTLSSRR